MNSVTHADSFHSVCQPVDGVDVLCLWMTSVEGCGVLFMSYVLSGSRGAREAQSESVLITRDESMHVHRVSALLETTLESANHAAAERCATPASPNDDIILQKIGINVRFVSAVLVWVFLNLLITRDFRKICTHTDAQKTEATQVYR